MLARRLRKRRTRSTPKALTQLFAKDGELSFLFSLAERLHMTVSELQQKMTPEEMLLWTGYLGYQLEQQQEMERRSRRR
jgi:hypothetical protein